MGLKKRAAMFFGAMLFSVIGVSVAIAAPAVAATEHIEGTITCYYGNNQNVGVWVQTSNGTSGWAHLGVYPNGQHYYSYDKVNVGGYYQLHVGCGGTPQNWGISFSTPTVNGTYYDWICTSGYGCYAS